MVKVSIIIPVYNVEEYLVECMDSVTGQTLNDIEIICVNDGSTDSSLQILKKYRKKDERIILIDKENGGYGQAMNRGFEKASGEYVGIVEPDDYVPLNMYEELYEKASKYELDFVKADFYRFKRSSNGNMELYYNHLSPKTEDILKRILKDINTVGKSIPNMILVINLIIMAAIYLTYISTLKPMAKLAIVWIVAMIAPRR